MIFLPIVPIKYIKTLGSITGACMVLAHWVNGNSAYAKAYKTLRKKCFTILDNGACELGKSLSAKDLLNAYITVSYPDVVVIPDGAKNDSKKLFEMFKSKIDTFRQYNEKVRFMAVPKSIEDLVFFAEQPEVDIIGLNRDFEVSSSRGDLIYKYCECGKKFHILGLRKNPIGELESVLKYNINDVVESMDSSLPYRIAKLGRRVEEYKPYPKVIDMYEKSLSNEVFDHCVSEIVRINNLCRGLK